ncbi:pyridoxal phosphate-dependent transferase [Suillus subalutaceus]|uniref:pyridoxal phosphate-dependent transferase n=1 Tax=Suillus subalutaceus TaxID=48586 RepID=UPI001B86C807|nr:pyridoxal phosphate-dependent transferase [Suillus subalutaceus]KAG1857004.1 pyridoxal phosphate-dependent transferase [Suillus subalutaceus]
MVFLPPTTSTTSAVDVGLKRSHVDYYRHLSSEARSRLPNPIKSIWKAAQVKTGTINMGNGDPHHTLYPICEMNFVVPSIEEHDPVQSWRSGTGEQNIIASYKDDPCTLSLRTAFAYGAGAGLKEVRDALADLNDRIHSPPNHTVSLSLGNADALTKCFRLLGDPGDSFLCEEFTFSAMTNAALPLGIKWVPIRMDNNGLVPSDLERILSNWDEATQGKRPHVLYTIPCSQNPTGSTLSLERRQQIYQIAHDWDIIILEDDPYFFLQVRCNSMGTTRAIAEVLPRSFLSMDYDGRVMRLDSFSKIVAPGMRLGWVTSNSFFAEKLDMLTDSSSQHPHGMGQAFISELLGSSGWGVDGFMKWILSLCNEYQRRRDLFMDVFRQKVAISGFATAEGTTIWDTPTVPGGPTTNTADLMDELFRKLLNSGLVMMPASTFAIVDRTGTTGSHINDRVNFFRATFVGTDVTIRDGLTIFGRTLEEFFF